MKLKDFDFRLWDNKKAKFVDLNKQSIFFLKDDLQKEGKFVLMSPNLIFSPVLNTDDFEIDVYTGFIDEKGTKIYEGDIVKIENSVGVIEFSLGIGSYVRYCDKSISLGALHPYIEKIIGNIHENLELLGGEK